MEYILLIVGFVLLIKGADFFVDGSASVASIMKIPPVIIGLTIVALGTSAPEAAVSIVAGLEGSNELALSNVVGSNIFNVLVVLGMSALIKPFGVNDSLLKRDMPINIGLNILLLLLIFNGILSRVDGIVLLVSIAAYITLLVRNALSNRNEDCVTESLLEEEEEIKVLSTGKSIAFIGIGIVAIILGGKLVVESATTIALTFGMSESLVGLTIVAIGTSLPELVTSVVAARKGQSDLAIGNVIGSNIFNIAFVLGASSLLSPIKIIAGAWQDVLTALIATFVVMLFCYTKRHVKRAEGGVLVALYIAYTAYIILR